MQNTRMTKQRATILDELRKVVSHPTADEIYGMVRCKIPHISLGTVYRNLELLADNKEVQKLEYAGFQKRFDGNTRPHAHVRCERCGRVADVHGRLPEPQLPEGIEAPDFTILAVRMEFLGLCAQCRQ
ncbi:MAG: transcriptional repressor [Desulfovibrionaceae bacterium]|nr:transcriptional repressor [Desulfovibrionaceae bacterium]